MILAFKIIFFVVMLITTCVAIAGGEKDERMNATGISLASIAALVASYIWF